MKQSFENPAAKKFPDAKAESRTLEPNVVEIETEKGRFSIVYSLHDIPVRPETIRNVDAVILELVGNYDSLEGAKKDIDLASDKRSSYRYILPTAARSEQPLFFLDFIADESETKKLAQEMGVKNQILPMVEFLFGTILTIGGTINYGSKNRLERTRRDFLKLGGASLLGAYLSLPKLSQVLEAPYAIKHQVPGQTDLIWRAHKMSGNFSKLIHPEMRSVGYETRNILIAQKSETVAKLLAQELKRKPKLSIIVGAGHYGLEHTLQIDENSRVGKLAKDLGDKFRKQGAITRVDFQPTEDPEKKRIEISFLRDEHFK